MTSWAGFWLGAGIMLGLIALANQLALVSEWIMHYSKAC